MELKKKIKKISKYPLERGVEWQRRFTTGQEAVITTAEALYTHTAQTGAREEKYKPQTKRTRGKQTLHSDRSTFTKAQAQL